MRGFYLSIIWIMALAVTMAYAGEDFKPRRIQVDEKEDKPVFKPKRIIKKEDPVEEEEYQDDEEEEVVDRSVKYRSLEMGVTFGRPMGCIISNCQSFMPMQRMCGGIYVQGYANQCMPPQQRPVIYQDIIVPEYPSQFGMRNSCGCQGVYGCGCSQQPSTNVLFVNNVQPMPNVMPTWQPLTARVDALFQNNPTYINLPPQPQLMNLGPRDGGFIPRLGVDPHAGMI